MRSLSSLDTSSTSKLTTPSPTTPTTKTRTFSAPAIVQKSPWHSPVPYLFGGLAAMLGLIAFALLLLACSYWRSSAGNINNEESSGERDLEEAADGKSENSAAAKVMPVFEKKIVVIMAGDINPTFLATPISSRAPSFGDGVKKNENFEKEIEGIVEKPKHEVNHDDHQHHDQTEDGNQSHEVAAQESP